jgi:MFS family permease
VRTYLGVLALFTLGASADSFLLLRAVDVGVPAAWVPLVWLALSGVKAASNVPGGKIADRLGRRKTVAAGWAAYALVYATLPLATSPPVFVAIVLAYGAYYGLTEGPERALLVSLTPPAARGRALGAMHGVTGLAVLPANLAFGALYGIAPRLAFFASAGCAALATVLLLFLVPREEGR